MFPGIYGFHWSPGFLIFLGVFYSVLMVIGVTVGLAVWRAVKAFRSDLQETIRWKSDFQELSPQDRTCRHVWTGEFKQRVCENQFECWDCAEHARLTAKALPSDIRVEENFQATEDVFGLEVPLDRFYHRGHTWVKPENDGTVHVGLDDLGARMMPDPEVLDLPPVGAKLKVNGIGWFMKKSGVAIRVLAPISGEVVAAGGPEQGWFLKVKPEAGFNLRSLLHGNELRPWFLRELDRLQSALAVEGVGVSLADGGVPVRDLGATHPKADWQLVCDALFLRP
ncbi:MAG: hypothetical protein PHX83_07955 [Acidobacteriia bacterium]|nr:hypothetical protein [Terriglobia bacterium]